MRLSAAAIRHTVPPPYRSTPLNIPHEHHSMSSRRQIKLGMFLRPGGGHHIAGWRHPDAWADNGLNFARYIETARTAERGLFDMLFSADALTDERYDLDT